MAKDQDEEIEDADSDTEINGDEDEDTDEDKDESKDADKSEDDDEEAEGDDDDKKSDSDDDAPLPKTRKELNAAIAQGVREALKSSGNRSAADRRTSGKDRTTGKDRPARKDGRVDELASTVSELKSAEAKRQFGYENSLAPDEVDVVYRLSKNPTAKTLRDPVVKGALEGHRTAMRAKANIPSNGGSGRPQRQAGKENRTPTPAEQRTSFTNRRQEILNNKRNNGR